MCLFISNAGQKPEKEVSANEHDQKEPDPGKPRRAAGKKTAACSRGAKPGQRTQNSLLKRLFKAFINPFTVVLLVLAVISFVTDVVMAAPGDKDAVSVIIVLAMVLISGTLQFVQETRSEKSAEKLSELVETTTAAIRGGVETEIPLDEIVVGDVVRLAAGDMIPADVRILQAKDLFVSQSSLTGESEPVEKFGRALKGEVTDVYGEQRRKRQRKRHCGRRGRRYAVWFARPSAH